VIYVAPAFENVPQGLAVEGGPYIAAVRYSGQLASLPQLKPADVRVTVSLTGAGAGTVTVTPTATLNSSAPANLRIDGVDSISVRVGAVPPP
jgi:hypothetical protein